MDIELGKYRHYKGDEYEVIGVGRDNDTLEEMVIYKGLYNSEEFGTEPLWIRSKTEFLQMVEVAGKTIPRFTHLNG